MADLIPGHGHMQPPIWRYKIPCLGTDNWQMINTSLSHQHFFLSLPFSLLSLPLSLKSNGEKCPQVRIKKNLQALYLLEITVAKFLINVRYSVLNGILFVKVIFSVIIFSLAAQIKWVEIISYCFNFWNK